MFLLAISETSVGLSLSIYRWKALPEQNINMQKYFNNTLLSSNPKRMKSVHFCPPNTSSPEDFAAQAPFFCCTYLKVTFICFNAFYTVEKICT